MEAEDGEVLTMATPTKIIRQKMDPKLIQQLPRMNFFPFISSFELNEIIKIYPHLPPLEFSIGSVGEFIQNLSAPRKDLEITDVRVSIVDLIRSVPAYSYPIHS